MAKFAKVLVEQKSLNINLSVSVRTQSNMLAIYFCTLQSLNSFISNYLNDVLLFVYSFQLEIKHPLEQYL